MCESLIAVVFFFFLCVQPDVVLYHNNDIFPIINQHTRQSIPNRPITCERNQTRTCEHITRRQLMKSQPGFQCYGCFTTENTVYNRSAKTG